MPEPMLYKYKDAATQGFPRKQLSADKKQLYDKTEAYVW